MANNMFRGTKYIGYLTKLEKYSLKKMSLFLCIDMLTAPEMLLRIIVEEHI